jgi:uncharacterized membrane protein YhhN
MLSCLIIVILACPILAWYIIQKSKKYDLKELFLKTILSILFVVLAVVATFESGKITVFNLFVIIGLVLGLIGDILLDLKYIDLDRTKGYTYGGFVFFGVGHICYMSGLISNFYSGKIIYIILGIILDIVLSSLIIILEKPLKLNYGKFKMICIIYALCLFGTLSLTLLLSIENNFQIVALNIFLLASSLFTISDLVLSGTYFGEGKERPIDFVLNYVTYYGAQYLIAFLLLVL